MDNDQTEELLEILREIQKTLKQIAHQTIDHMEKGDRIK